MVINPRLKDSIVDGAKTVARVVHDPEAQRALLTLGDYSREIGVAALTVLAPEGVVAVKIAKGLQIADKVVRGAKIGARICEKAGIDLPLAKELDKPGKRRSIVTGLVKEVPFVGLVAKAPETVAAMRTLKGVWERQSQNPELRQAIAAFEPEAN